MWWNCWRRPARKTMPIIDYTEKEVIFRVAACGPAGAGKTTLLWQLHAGIPADERSELTIRAIGADQLVSFDCAAPDLIPVGDYRAKFRLFTVPGRVADPAIWQRVMDDVDGVIFVADSQFERVGENADVLRALAGLQGALGAPMVFIYNKRDLPNRAPLEYLDHVLNSAEPRVPRFEGVMTDGKGASDALKALTKLLLDRAVAEEEKEAASERVEAAALERVSESLHFAPPEVPLIPVTTQVDLDHALLPKNDDSVSMDGGCLCGGVRYRLMGLPIEVFHSHAAEHTRGHGAPLVTWAAYAPQDFVVLRGSPSESVAQGNVRAFCRECGTPLTFRKLDDDALLIAAATLDSPELLTPVRHESAAEALPWPKIIDGLPRSL